MIKSSFFRVVSIFFGSLSALLSFIDPGAVHAIDDTTHDTASMDRHSNLHIAASENKMTGKPLLSLSSEILYCLRHEATEKSTPGLPLLLEAIATEFIPVQLASNLPKTQHRTEQRHCSSALDRHQYIGFFDNTGVEVLADGGSPWNMEYITSKMVTVLEILGRPVPGYLKTLQLEHDTSLHNKAAFAMACFWTGEYTFGKLDGVIATEAGWYDNREVTLITFHTKLISLNELIAYASREGCAQRVYLLPGDSADRNRFTIKPFVLSKYRVAKNSDQKKQLSRWPEINTVENLTTMQRTKLNALGPNNRAHAIQWLSPAQWKQLIH